MKVSNVFHKCVNLRNVESIVNVPSMFSCGVGEFNCENDDACDARAVTLTHTRTHIHTGKKVERERETNTGENAKILKKL